MRSLKRSVVGFYTSTVTIENHLKWLWIRECCIKKLQPAQALCRLGEDFFSFSFFLSASASGEKQRKVGGGEDKRIGKKGLLLKWSPGMVGPERKVVKPGRRCTVGQIHQEPRCKYWATHSSICLFARTIHSFACSALLILLTRALRCTHSFVGSLSSLTPLLVEQWMIR